MRETRWKAVLFALWTVAAIALVAQTLDRTGLGGRAWFGWWDAIAVRTAEPFVVRIAHPRPGGASATAGIRDGDRIDLREHGLDARVRVMWQLLATRPTVVTIHRDNRTLPVSVTGSTFGEGSPARRAIGILTIVPAAFFLACALLIIRRRSETYEGRALAAFLVFLVVAQMTRPEGLVVPNGILNLFLTVGSSVFALAAGVILVRLTSRVGARHGWRNLVEWIAYAAVAISFTGAVAGAIGVWTLWFDPIPFVFGSFWGTFRTTSAVAVAIAAAVAVASSARSEQPRTGWLLLPLPLILAVTALLNNTAGVQSWSELWVILIAGILLSFVGATLVTFALLRRRVLDVGFVVSRSIVVGVLSLVVVAAFILLEWLLGSVAANVSHAEGVAANAGLALVLGLSIRLLHQRVDTLVDTLMFRKRHEDTSALRDFSKEAAFATEREALADLAIDKIRKHTDARNAGLYFRESGGYGAVRSFNEAAANVRENDAAVLALKAWHKPLDPHAYESDLKGDLALPMVGRGQLLGFLLCGERVSGEAYAPDEVDALAQFAQAVGSAFDGLTADAANEHDTLLQAIRDLQRTIDRHFAQQ